MPEYAYRLVYVILLIFWGVCGFLTLDLHRQKGYEGGFFVGFLFGILGLIYSAGLPDRMQKVIKKKNGAQVMEVEETERDEEDNDYNFTPCKNCGFPIYDDEKKCSKCGTEKVSKAKK